MSLVEVGKRHEQLRSMTVVASVERALDIFADHAADFLNASLTICQVIRQCCRGHLGDVLVLRDGGDTSSSLSPQKPMRSSLEMFMATSRSPLHFGNHDIAASASLT